jgi:hypothetical protein
MNRIPVRGVVALMAWMILAAPLAAQSVIPIPVINGGAEAGNLSGWTDPIGQQFYAVNDSANARGGDWFFETAALFNSTGGGLFQSIDLTPYAGNLLSLTFSYSLAQEPGSAFGDSTAFHYEASAILYFFGANNTYLGGQAFPANAGPAWQDYSAQYTNATMLQQAEQVDISLQGVWAVTGGGAGYSVPTDWITDPPLWSRFDNISLRATIVPEPSAGLAGAMVGLLMLWRRRSS